VFDRPVKEWYCRLMFGFLVKKTFFDMWDNLLRIILLNLGFYPFFVLIYPFKIFSISLAEPSVISFLIAFCALFIALAPLLVYIGAASCICSDIVDYKGPGFADFWSYVKKSYASCLILALLLSVYVTAITVAMPFYIRSFLLREGEGDATVLRIVFTLQSILLGVLPFGLILAITVYSIFALQYFFPIQSRLDRKFKKIMRKVFLLFFDNPFFSIVLLLCAAPMIVAIRYMPAIVMFIGPAAVLLWWNAAFKLRLYKYDYLESNPGASRRKIPWDALLLEDRERVGKRTLKGMIFPWKE